MKVKSKLVQYLNKGSLAIAALTLLFMLLLTVLNTLTTFLGFPIKGSFELLGFAGAILGGLALGPTQAQEGHIRVTLLDNRWGSKSTKIIQIVSLFLCIFLFVVLGIKLVELTHSLYEFEELSQTLNIIFYPFVAIVALGVFLLVLNLIAQLVYSLRGK